MPTQEASLVPALFTRAFDIATATAFVNGMDAEVEAAVSHWLQNMGGTSIGLSSNDVTILKQAIAYDLARGGSARAPERLRIENRADRPMTIDFSEFPFGPVSGGRSRRFRFVDLFAGIGGFRLALDAVGGRCVFSSEIDAAASSTYFANFGEVPFGDIRRFTGMDVKDEEIASTIPDHDVLAAGFPCQPFSRAGVSSRSSLGLEHGFADTVSGTLFFDIVRIAAVKRPKVLFLENVRNLERHDGGRTFGVIRETILQLGYSFTSEVIDAAKLVPQRRQRSFMICFRDGEFEFDLRPFVDGEDLPLRQALQTDADPRFTISDELWSGHVNRTKRNLERGTGFTAYEADLDRPANTLVARYGKDGKECLIPQPGMNPRMLTPRECARLQGFPEEFRLPSAKTVAYRQLGNAVAVPVVKELAEQIKKQAGL